MTVLVLASASPRRRALLAAAGIDVDEVVPADVDESPRAGERAAALVRRLAASKRDVVAADRREDTVLAADTVVALGERILGKPRDDQHAREMLHELSGRVVTVWTGVAVGGAVPWVTSAVGTDVHFQELSGEVVESYVATGEPRGAAGAFRIQGRGRALVASVAGCPSNVAGLPVCETIVLLGGAIIGHDPPACAVLVGRIPA